MAFTFFKFSLHRDPQTPLGPRSRLCIGSPLGVLICSAFGLSSPLQSPLDLVSQVPFDNLKVHEPRLPRLKRRSECKKNIYSTSDAKPNRNGVGV